MRTVTGLLALLVMLVFAMGTAPTAAVGDTRTMSGGSMGICEYRFDAADIGGKGYLTERDLQEFNFGPSLKDSRGRAYSKLVAMDKDGDGVVSVQEYCAWRAPTGFSPTRSR